MWPTKTDGITLLRKAFVNSTKTDLKARKDDMPSIEMVRSYANHKDWPFDIKELDTMIERTPSKLRANAV